MKVRTYNEWFSVRDRELSISTKKIECPKCQGLSEITEECDCCGHEYDLECYVCEGSGAVIFSDLDKDMKMLVLSKLDYYKNVKSDLSALASYKNLDLGVLYQKQGFSPYCNLHTEAGKKVDILFHTH